MLAPAAAKRMATMAGMTRFMGSASPATTVSTPEAIIAYPPKRCDLRHTSSLLRLQGVRRPKASFRSDFGMMLPQMTKAMPATRAAPLPTLRSSAANGEPLLESPSANTNSENTAIRAKSTTSAFKSLSPSCASLRFAMNGSPRPNASASAGNHRCSYLLPMRSASPLAPKCTATWSGASTRNAASTTRLRTIRA